MNESEQRIRFFHVCTDGTSNGIVHFSDEDYEQADKTTAVSALKAGVHIVCHCHMSTHSHFVVWCNSKEDAMKFGETYKHDYSLYVYKEHKVSCVYRGVSVTVREIIDAWDLRGCIAYTLLNPVTARIVTSPESYKWSSFCAYFQKPGSGLIPVSELSSTQLRKIFRTHYDLKGSGFMVDEEGHIDVKTFVDYRFVEKLFGGVTKFFKVLAVTDCAEEELKYTDLASTVKYTDDDLRTEALALAKKKYGRDDLDALPLEQKARLVLPLRKKTGAVLSRLARVLRLNYQFVKRLVGDSSDDE